ENYTAAQHVALPICIDDAPGKAGAHREGSARPPARGESERSSATARGEANAACAADREAHDERRACPQAQRRGASGYPEAATARSEEHTSELQSREK